MQRSPFVIATTVIAASLAWGLVLAFGSGPLVPSAAALLAGDQLIMGTVIGVGLVLSRGRWTRRAGFALLGGQALLGIFFEADGWWAGAVLMTAIGIAALAGPWLGGWLRKLPRADGPPSMAVTMNLGLVGLPALVAVTAPGGFPLPVGCSVAWLWPPPGRIRKHGCRPCGRYACFFPCWVLPRQPLFRGRESLLWLRGWWP